MYPGSSDDLDGSPAVKTHVSGQRRTSTKRRPSIPQWRTPCAPNPQSDPEAKRCTAQRARVHAQSAAGDASSGQHPRESGQETEKISRLRLTGSLCCTYLPCVCVCVYRDPLGWLGWLDREGHHLNLYCIASSLSVRHLECSSRTLYTIASIAVHVVALSHATSTFFLPLNETSRWGAIIRDT